MSKRTKLESVHQIGGKTVKHIGTFLGFDLYQSTDEDDYAGDIITYFVKSGEVHGQTTTSYSGGAENSASAVVSFNS